MTDAEFKLWDRHKVENLLGQRDDALARLEEAKGIIRDLTDARAADAARLANDAAAALEAERQKARDREAQITAAFDSRLDEARKAFADDRDAAVASARAEADRLREKLERVQAYAEKTFAELSEARNLIDALGGTDEGIKRSRAARRQELERVRDEAQHELDGLAEPAAGK